MNEGRNDIDYESFGNGCGNTHFSSGSAYYDTVGCRNHRDSRAFDGVNTPYIWAKSHRFYHEFTAAP